MTYTHKYKPLSIVSLGIDPSTSDGITGSLVPITSNRSHQHLRKPVLAPCSHIRCSHPHPLSIAPSVRAKLLIHSLHAGRINPGVLCSLGVGSSVSSSYTQPGINIQQAAEFWFVTAWVILTAKVVIHLLLPIFLLFLIQYELLCV